jgi:hypothetical protein
VAIVLIDQRAVRTAEDAVTMRKARLGAQWAAARAQARDKVTHPTTLVSVALVGGILGWRSAAPKAEAQDSAPQADERKHEPGLLGGTLRTFLVAGLQVLASVATEEFLRTMSARSEEAAESAKADAVDASG